MSILVPSKSYTQALSWNQGKSCTLSKFSSQVLYITLFISLVSLSRGVVASINLSMSPVVISLLDKLPSVSKVHTEGEKLITLERTVVLGTIFNSFTSFATFLSVGWSNMYIALVKNAFIDISDGRFCGKNTRDTFVGSHGIPYASIPR